MLKDLTIRVHLSLFSLIIFFVMCLNDLLLVLIHLELLHYFGELTLFSLSSAP